MTNPISNATSNNSLLNENFEYLKYLEEIAVVTETIHPGKSGRIRYQGSYWSALCTQNVILFVGSTVRVIGIKTITYIVEPYNSHCCQVYSDSCENNWSGWFLSCFIIGLLFFALGRVEQSQQHQIMSPPPTKSPTITYEAAPLGFSPPR